MRLPGSSVPPATGVARVGLGGLILLRPELLGRLYGTDSVTAKRTAWLARMIASRELALGVGTLNAVSRGRGARPWLVAQMVADAGDAAALVLAIRARHVRPILAGLTVAVAAAAIAAEALGVRDAL